MAWSIRSLNEEITIFPGLKDKMRSAVETMKIQAKLNTEINHLVLRWKQVMAETNTYNNSYQTYTLTNIQQQDYGWSANILCPAGLDLPGLEKLKDKIESGLECIFLHEVKSSNTMATCNIVYERLVKANEIPYSPQKVKPWQLYFGVRITGEPVIFDVNITPHVLLAGQQRRGKNGGLDHALPSLISSCTPFEVGLVLYQGAKNDLIKYKQCEHVRAFIMGEFEEFLAVLEYVKMEMQRRTELLEHMVASMKGDNIFHYNNMNSSHNRLPYLYIVIDEFPSLMPANSDSKTVKNTKNQILDLLSEVGRWGGALGVNYIICHQKPEKELMPTFIKNMSSIRVCFGFDDRVCSEIVLGNELAWKLPARRAYFSADGKTDLLFTTDLKGRIEPVIRPHFMPHKTWLDIIKPRIQGSTSRLQQRPPADYSKVYRSPEQLLNENIKKIDGWVPYQPQGGKIKK